MYFIKIIVCPVFHGEALSFTCIMQNIKRTFSHAFVYIASYFLSGLCESNPTERKYILGRFGLFWGGFLEELIHF